MKLNCSDEMMFIRIPEFWICRTQQLWAFWLGEFRLMCGFVDSSVCVCVSLCALCVILDIIAILHLSCHLISPTIRATKSTTRPIEVVPMDETWGRKCKWMCFATGDNPHLNALQRSLRDGQQCTNKWLPTNLLCNYGHICKTLFPVFRVR